MPRADQRFPSIAPLDDRRFVQFYLERAAAALLSLITSGVINNDLAHRAGGYREEKWARLCQLGLVWLAVLDKPHGQAPLFAAYDRDVARS